MRYLSSLLTTLVCAMTAVGQQPNFLVVVLDDVGVDKIAAYGEHPTPPTTVVIDSIASVGQIYRNAYAMPVCSPTRAATLTGRYPFRTGIGNGAPSGSYQFPLATEETLPQVLACAGYRTAVVGKWHLSNGTYPDVDLHPIDFGFDVHVGSRQNVGDYYNWTRNHVTAEDGVISSAVVTDYVTRVNVDDAISLIGAHGEWPSADPWLMWLTFNAPHTPVHVPPRDLYTGPTLTGDEPDSVLYGAMLEALDRELGRLLASMRPGVLEKTYIIVMGDNGTYAAAIMPPFGGLGNSKGGVLEGGINVPLIVHGPGVVPGYVTGLVSCTDVFSTITQLAGCTPTSGNTLDSVSLVPYFIRPTLALRETVFAQRHKPNGHPPHNTYLRGIRDARYKYIVRETVGVTPLPDFALYDLRLDPFETQNLVSAATGAPLVSASPEAVTALAALQTALAALQ